MTLSIPAKEAIKTALAMTIAYGIALAMDWSTPMWAGFSVAFVSLASSGQSFNKSAMRILGTVIAGVTSVCLIGLFPQDRWLFMLALSLYVGFCTYMMGSAKYQYFWFVCGYVCIIVALESGPNSVTAFTLAILRVQETGLGIIVYSVITVLLWRSNSSEKINVLVAELHTSQHQLYRSYLKRMNGQDAEPKALIIQRIQQQDQFKTLLDGAETDSYEIWEVRQQWRLYQNQQVEITDIIERLFDGFSREQQSLLTNLNVFDEELEQRFRQMQAMQQGRAPEFLPQAIELQIDKQTKKTLSPFQQVALLATQSNLQQLEQLTYDLFNNLADIRGFRNQPSPVKTTQATKTGFAFDIERLASIIQVMVTLWLSFLAFIYIYDLPGGILLAVVAGVIGMSLAANPNMPVSIMYMPFVNSTLFCTVLYAIIMPQLSSFFGLGIMIFITTFLICYIYSSPQQGMGRAVGLAVFVTMISVNNQQSYNILTVFNTALVFMEMFVILLISANIPFSANPRKAFIRLRNRFFRSSHYVLTTLNPKSQPALSFWKRQRNAFHCREINTLPDKIKTRSQLIKTEVLQGASTQQIQTITDNFQMIKNRLHILFEVSTTPQAKILTNALINDSQIWRTKIQQSFQQLLNQGTLENQTELNEITSQLETRIKIIINDIKDNQLSEQDEINFYQLHGAYQRVSDSLLEYSANARLIDWNEWQEARF